MYDMRILLCIIAVDVKKRRKISSRTTPHGRWTSWLFFTRIEHCCMYVVDENTRHMYVGISCRALASQWLTHSSSKYTAAVLVIPGRLQDTQVRVRIYINGREWRQMDKGDNRTTAHTHTCTENEKRESSESLTALSSNNSHATTLRRIYLLVGMHGGQTPPPSTSSAGYSQRQQQQW